MGINFDVYSIAKLVEGGIPHQLELVENAITKLGSNLEPLTIYEKHVFVVNKENGEFWRLNYTVTEGNVRFYDPVPLYVEVDHNRLAREQSKITKSIVEALSEGDDIEVDNLKAQWIRLQRNQNKLEQKLNLKVGAKSAYIQNAKRIVTEAVNSTRGAKTLINKGFNKSLLSKLLKEGEILINPTRITRQEEPKSRQTLIFQKIVEGRQAALTLNESPVFTEYLINLYEDKDADEAIEFIAENYQEIYTLSIREQTELFYNILEKRGIDPVLEDVVECVLDIGRYAINAPSIRQQLEKLTNILEAENGNFHERMQLIEKEINSRHFTENDITVLRNVIKNVLESPSDYLAPEFLVELRKAARRLQDMSENGSYDDACIAAVINLLSNFYPTQTTLGEGKESGNKEEYQKFFNSKLEKYGVSSPAELDDEKKKEFFNEIEREWDGEKESKNKKDGGVNVQSNDKNAEKTIYSESKVCKNCGSPKCLCSGLLEEEDIMPEKKSGEDDDTDDEQIGAIETLQKKYKEYKESGAKAKDWDELHKSVKSAKKSAKDSDLEELEELEDDIIEIKSKV